jgi:ubiquinone/menaquinone biosynthesis C-methylase UbiE
MSNYDKSAEVYDAIYATKKDYAKEADKVHAIIQEYKQSNDNDLLDVACGTGLHAAALLQWYNVEGLDLSESQLTVARRRIPNIKFYHADMTDFELGKRYDVVISLFSAIGELLDIEQVNSAVKTMAKHLKPGGVLIIEPWLRPEQFNPNRIWTEFIEEPELKIARMTIARRHGKIVELAMHYMVGRPGKIEKFIERHQEALHTVDEYINAFQQAGLVVSYDKEGLIGRGLFIGSKP